MAKHKVKSEELLLCVALKRTADGFVAYRGLVPLDACEALTPEYIRDIEETRPKDVTVPALMQGTIGGQAELRRAHVNKGVPVMTKVGKQRLQGENLDAAVLRARNELKRQTYVAMKDTAQFWQHACSRKLKGMPEYLKLRAGEVCGDCGAHERRKERAA